MPAFADLSNAETIAAGSGRIIGAAKACDVDGSRLRALGEKVFAVLNVRAKSERDQGSATGIFASTYNTGIDQVASGKIKCAAARSAFKDLELKFSKY